MALLPDSVDPANLTAPERYARFIKDVANRRSAWGLANGGWAVARDPEGKLQIPLWPDRSYAEMHASDDWEGYIPVEIDLRELLDGMLPSLTQADHSVGVFFVEGSSSVCAAPEVLREHLNLAIGYVH